MSSFFSCSCNLQISAQVAQLSTAMLHFPSSRRVQQPLLDVKCLKTELSPQRVLYNRRKGGIRWSFLGGSRVILQEQVENVNNHRKGSTVSACWLANSQIASSAFTLGTVAVLPFYTLMVAAPNARITKRTMESTVPYVMLGILYAYLLYISWTPDTLRLMFASKYWLPELPGITRMFSNELTAASAWIHLLTVDLFAARQVYHDGIKNKVETRHSVSLCLLFCPIGIATHAITKFLQKPSGESH